MIPAMSPSFSAASTDPSFSSVVQLAHFDGTNGSTTFTNSCPRGNTFGVNGSAVTLSTGTKKFGTASLSLAGTGDVLAASHADYAIGTSDFTLEGWSYFTSPFSASEVIIDMRPTGTDGAYPAIYVLSTGDIYYYVSTANRISSATGVMVVATQQFVAVSRVSGVTRLFVDGVQVGSNYTDSTTYLQSSIRIGRGAFSTGGMTGFVDDFRFTKGVGRYSANFTPPVAAFPNS